MMSGGESGQELCFNMVRGFGCIFGTFRFTGIFVPDLNW